MTATAPEVLVEEQRRAEEVYDRVIRPALRPEDHGKYLAIAFELDDYELDSNDYTAIKRLLHRHPGARVWLMRADRSAAYRFAGGKHS